MRASRGQIKIEDVLKDSGLNFEEQYAFPGLVSLKGNPLRFDFAVFDDQGNIDFLIEYQGIQHYQPKDKFGGVAGLRKQQFNDMRKRQYCQAHGITLIEIPYLDQGLINYDYIMTRAGYA